MHGVAQDASREDVIMRCTCAVIAVIYTSRAVATSRRACFMVRKLTVHVLRMLSLLQLLRGRIRQAYVAALYFFFESLAGTVAVRAIFLHTADGLRPCSRTLL
jgi:hypothetical protein